MTTYQYAAENRLSNRHRYMYTPFEGPEFLRAYFDQRATWKNEARTTSSHGSISPEIVDDIVSRLLVQETASSVWKEHRYRVLPAQPGEVDFVTRDLLLDLWFRPRNTGQDSDTAKSWLDSVIRKFEVSGRLYQRYGVDLKPIIKQYADPVNYALLASLAVYQYIPTSNLKYLNVTLKLLDLLSSLPIENCDSAVREIGCAATIAETKAIRQLIAQQQVTL